MIKNFKDKETLKIFSLQTSKKLPRDIQQRAYVKLQMLNSADNILDLKNPPSNHLKKSQGDRKDEYSIRINDQFRICFEFNEEEGNAYNVSIVDYH